MHNNLTPVPFTDASLEQLGKEMRDAATPSARMAVYVKSSSEEEALQKVESDPNIQRSVIEGGMSRCIEIPDGVISVCLTLDVAPTKTFWNASLCKILFSGAKKRVEDAEVRAIIGHLIGVAFTEANSEPAFSSVRQFHSLPTSVVLESTAQQEVAVD